MKNIIFYFSGTGNSLFLAKKIAEKISETELIRITDRTKFSNEDFEKFKNIENIGVIFPVNCFGLPPIVRQFMKNFFSRLKSAGFCDNKYIFVVLNYGGLSGQSFSQLEHLFKNMSVHLSLSAGIKMPDNYIPAYKIPSNLKIKKFLNEAEEKIANIVNLVQNKKTSRDKKSLPSFVVSFLEWIYRMVYNAFVDILKRKNFAKNFWVDEKCNGCGVCEKVCPVSNVVLNNERKPVWNDKCEFCLACISWCPQKAFNIKKILCKKRDIIIQILI